MKKLMIGNEAVARGLYEGGLKVVSSYPGTPSTEITEFLSKYDDIYSEWAPNEKVAAEVCFGASVGGVRCACAMKHVGLNVAADPLFTLSYTGVRGGMVICVADDPGMHSSQNEQDSRHYAIGAKVPMLEPADSSECLEFAISDDLIVINIQIDTHNIAAFCISNSTYTAGILNLAHISRVIKMVHYLFAIHTSLLSFPYFTMRFSFLLLQNLHITVTCFLNALQSFQARI